uniref:Uncharacterized protein n=1 Tax=Candidatus Kentrum sp. DK TaxID=2126562 RepID=A0A450TH16_9GAMM|nr:MAG: hypothetical protein BECKDK2373B_GA0170837_117010 [Candidatus Kentron sp. DK]
MRKIWRHWPAGKELEHLLRYYNRLAGLEEGQKLKTTDGFVAWARVHRPGLDLTRPPRNPFRMASH